MKRGFFIIKTLIYSFRLEGPIYKYYFGVNGESADQSLKLELISILDNEKVFRMTIF